MYKAILVDDEALIRDAISKTVPWSEYGFELTATCQNAKEAVKILENDTPDLVITDICMPFMDGLELSKYIYENYPNVVVIIISGYDDFEYAKQAVHYKVSEYLLKPVTADEFGTILTKVKTNLDVLSETKEYINKIKTSYDENLPTLRVRFLESLISENTMPAEYISEKLDEFQPNLKGPYYCVCILNRVKNSENDENIEKISSFSIYTMAKDIIISLGVGEIFQNSNEQSIIYFSGKSSDNALGIARSACDEIHNMALKLLKQSINISIGKPVYSLHKLPISYQSALSLMDHFFLTGENQILQYDDFEPASNTNSINRTEWTNKILDFIKANKKEELDFVLEQFIQTLRKNHVTKSKAILYIQSVVLSIMNFLENTIFYTDALFAEEQLLFDKLSDMEHLSEMEAALTNFCNIVSSHIHSKHEDYSQKQAKLAMDFIEKNYNQSDLSLSDVCEHLAISTSRFSTIFKASTGETFVEALTRVRMEHAKDLLVNSSFKTYEIAEKIGFTDPHYFSISFKKYSKMTPTEYIKSHRED